MATDKNRINAYVDDEAFKAFEKFRQELNCSASKAVEVLIRRHLMLDYIEPNVTEKMNTMIKEEVERVLMCEHIHLFVTEEQLRDVVRSEIELTQPS